MGVALPYKTSIGSGGLEDIETQFEKESGKGEEKKMEGKPGILILA